MNGAQSNKGWHISLWVLQIVLGALFGSAGWMKSTQPVAALAQQMPWTAAVPEAMVRFIGIAEFAGALGLLLPALTRIKPQLTAWAGTGLATVMVLAGGFHASRGEWAMLPVVAVLGGLAGLIAYGRFKKAPLV